MDKLIQPINTWLNSKSESEQRLVKFGGGFFILFLVITLVTSMNDSMNETKNKLDKQLELNRWAQQQINIIKQATGSSGSAGVTNQSMTQVINSTARQHNIVIERIQPQQNDLVKVGINEIGFNTLMSWLTELQTQHNINIVNIDFSRSDTVGMVKLRRLDLGRK